MKFRLEVVCVNDEGEEQRGEVLAMERHQLAMETLGLNLTESKVLLERVQDFVVARQAAEDLEQRRSCLNCGERYTSKAGGTIEVKTVFGAVEVANPRWNRCQCQGSGLCAAVCRSHSIDLAGFTDQEMAAEISGALP